MADINMMNTVFRNLISNAIKFTHHESKVEIYSNIKQTHFQVIVEDNGKGMTNDEIAKLLRVDSRISSKWTNNLKGTGIDLILCKEFNDKHKGEILVKSEKEKGSQFIIQLPITLLGEN